MKFVMNNMLLLLVTFLYCSFEKFSLCSGPVKVRVSQTTALRRFNVGGAGCSALGRCMVGEGEGGGSALFLLTLLTRPIPKGRKDMS